MKMWHKVTLTFQGPATSEDDPYNPFMNYRLNVTFTHADSGESLKVPGYFAADGNAGESSATEGDKWRVHFAPTKEGVWRYHVDFRRQNFAAVSEKIDTGKSAEYMDGAEGEFAISKSDKSGRDMRSKGFLIYDGTRYLKFSGSGERFLKVGADAPENFLAYRQFDGTQNSDGIRDQNIKDWSAHLQDWREGDPTWQGGKGKEIIGAINYLASKGMNVFSFITNSIEGDDRNVFPYTDYNTYDRFDCSKLDQWEVLFEHGDKIGMFMHFKLMEFENQGLLDNGAVGALTKLYYREMIARFGHHLAINWNIGEEIGDWATPPTPPMFRAQRLAAAEFLSENDPYHHHIVIHNGAPFDDILGPESHYSGVSLQTHKPDFSLVHSRVLHWLEASAAAGKQWAVACDEPGDAQHSLLPDAEDALHDDARKNGLWGAFLAGAWGTEWYFGYKHAHSDLSCQDYRSRDLFWDQCRHLLTFFDGNNLDLERTESMDSLVGEGDYCLAEAGEIYITLLKSGSGSIDLSGVDGKFRCEWFDPRNGGALQSGKPRTVSGGGVVKLDGAPSEPTKDWVVLLRRR